MSAKIYYKDYGTPCDAGWEGFFFPSLRNMVDKQMEEQNMAKYIIGTCTNGNFSVSPNPAEHTNLALAKREAERLATVNPGKEFVVLKIEGKVKAQTVAWSN